MATDPVELEDDERSYPDGDGKPMAETPEHRRGMTTLIELLELWYEGNDRVYISGNMFLYYNAGRRGLGPKVSPDVQLTVGADRRPERRVYRTWVDGPPDLVVEFTSRSTRREDQITKFRLYRDTIGVREYVLFDPLSEYLDPSLQGFRLRDGEYVPIEPVENGRLPSEVLGCALIRSGILLRLWDTDADALVPTHAERSHEDRRLREEERRLRLAAEEEVAALRRQLEALRNPPPAEGTAPEGAS